MLVYSKITMVAPQDAIGLPDEGPVGKPLPQHFQNGLKSNQFWKPARKKKEEPAPKATFKPKPRRRKSDRKSEIRRKLQMKRGSTENETDGFHLIIRNEKKLTENESNGYQLILTIEGETKIRIKNNKAGLYNKERTSLHGAKAAKSHGKNKRSPKNKKTQPARHLKTTNFNYLDSQPKYPTNTDANDAHQDFIDE